MPIKVNQVIITDDEIHSEMQHHRAASMESARHKAAQALVTRQLLIQAAQETKLLDIEHTEDPEKTERAIDLLIKQQVSVPQADKKSCERYYQQNIQRFVDKKTNKELPFDSVFSHIRDYLHARSLRAGINQYINTLYDKAKVSGFDLEKNSNIPVQ